MRADSSRSRDTNERAGRGRPRSDEAHVAILETTVALLRKEGYDSLAIELVAARAGVAKATIYRRWAGKEALVVDAIGHIVASLPIPSTGTLRGDLRSLMRATVAMYRDPATAALLTGLAAAMARNATIADAVRRQLIEPRRQAFRAALDAGVRRGEVRRSADIELVIDVLTGPLFYRSLFTSRPVDQALSHALVELAVRDLAPRRGAAQRDADEHRTPRRATSRGEKR